MALHDNTSSIAPFSSRASVAVPVTASARPLEPANNCLPPFPHLLAAAPPAAQPTSAPILPAAPPSHNPDQPLSGNEDDRTSTSAYVLFLGSNAISWCSRKKRSVARSSTEAEYMVVALAASKVLWLSSLLHELLIPPTYSPTIYCDNISATYLCSNPVFHSRMKHITIDFHFVQEKVQRGQIRMSHVASADQLADSLTKPLSKTRFAFLRSKIGGSEMPTILRGRIKDIQSNTNSNLKSNSTSNLKSHTSPSPPQT
ncbi:hypothetical protein LWI29_030968 [Acer saccharum]|uniref:Uncharacterized protein n=1 Tax=Acer saccharum TaxID=4024 RepID=A0AA39S7R4_ACESA|nr:hypothetical protein LWI29_030968 [Acer saccharum]